MTKTLGFVVGVSLTIAAFALMLPRSQHRAADQHAPMTTVVASEIAQAADEVTGPMDVEQTDVSDDDAVELATFRTATPPTTAPANAPNNPADGTVEVIDADIASAESASSTAITNSTSSQALNTRQQAAASDTLQTHVFWSPFRSAWAARGFARRLSNATQIDIDVVEAGPSRYRAAFDYDDDAQRVEYIERIESITGLELE